MHSPGWTHECQQSARAVSQSRHRHCCRGRDAPGTCWHSRINLAFVSAWLLFLYLVQGLARLLLCLLGCLSGKAANNLQCMDALTCLHVFYVGQIFRLTSHARQLVWPLFAFQNFCLTWHRTQAISCKFFFIWLAQTHNHACFTSAQNATCVCHS